ncbi:MAG: DUF2752 domain-containing protein [Prevotellaceae bacterium]|jgi:hypothetical protein|nr:DUF2752 domain-containing protein [Prevotellaceae bacterium]
MTSFLEWWKEHLLTCPSKYFVHIDCPGCGLQRSIIALLEGDLQKSLALYPATIPILFCLIFTMLHLKFNFRYGAPVIKWSFALTVATIVVSYLYKLVAHTPLNFT